MRARASERVQVEHLQLIRVHVSEPDNGRETASGKQQYKTNDATGSPQREGGATVPGGRVIRATMKISRLLNAIRREREKRQRVPNMPVLGDAVTRVSGNLFRFTIYQRYQLISRLRSQV